MSNDLIFEIGAEEMPASFIPRALSSMEGLLRKRIESARLSCVSIKAFGTPRRLAFIVAGLPSAQPDIIVEIKGPARKAAYDEKGIPTKTLEGFIKGQGVSLGSIKIISTEKGEYVSVSKDIKGEATEKILPAMLKDVMSAELFPKTMRWSGFDVRFARPVHWIAAVYDGRKVEFDFGPVKSGDMTRGHRFLSPKEIKISSAGSYLKALRENFVVADVDERKALIKSGIEEKAAEVKGEILPDEGLVDEVACLVEWPVVLCGTFERGFLDLPRDVVVNAMREHQRYFTIIDAGGALLPYFITVANTKAKDPTVVIKGNERVLRARLGDAKFHYEKDVKIPLKDRVALLKGVVFQARLGTYYEKAERVARLTIHLDSALGYSGSSGAEEGIEIEDVFLNSNPSDFNPTADPMRYKKAVLLRAAMLAKADLVSGMVNEFPKLQGVMGSVYAKKDNEAPDVCEAIREHYLPTASAGALPASLPGAMVAVADKLDTITGCFGVGLIPTGGEDPYALRRQALGVIAIMLDKGFSAPLDVLVEKAISLFGKRLNRDKDAVKKDVLEFFKERLRNQLMAEGLSFDSIDAVLSMDWHDLPDAIQRINAIEAFKTHASAGRLVIAFKRVSNILKGVDVTGQADVALVADEAEKDLYSVISKIGPVISGCLEKGDYKSALETLAGIKEVIDVFFDKVLVMDKDPKIRQNRLALLNSIRSLYTQIADLSKLTI